MHVLIVLVADVFSLTVQSPKDTSYETKEWEFNVIDVSWTQKQLA